ncbi:unnamed protein product [Adineta ricciae]|uniref:Uncharacterized protein n=1 Tax=Adineta ricciae TaxID=249248 RepID=A0A815JGE8_ADIRI|nr:unnamed protein product [Adineta ricciae]
MHYIITIIALLLMLISIKSQTVSDRSYSETLQRLASQYCSIHDMKSWEQRGAILELIVKSVRRPRNTIDEIIKDYEQYRTEKECLKLVEYMPILIGHG